MEVEVHYIFFGFFYQLSIGVMGQLTSAEKIGRFRNRKNDVAYRNSESKLVERNVEKLVLIKCQSLRKRSTRSKLETDKESVMLKRKQGKKIPTLTKLHLPLLLPALYLVSINATPSSPMERL